MRIHGANRMSQIATCIDAAPNFLITREEAVRLVNHQVTVIVAEWDAVCDEAGLSAVDRNYFWWRQFLNPFALYGAPEGIHLPAA